MVNLVERCMAASGDDLPSALFLLRLSYWMRHTKFIRGGEYWATLPTERWLEETRLTPKQHKRAVSLLKRKGIIESKLSFFDGRKIALMRLTEHGVKVLAGTSTEKPSVPGGTSTQTPSVPVGTHTPLPLVPGGTCHNIEIYYNGGIKEKGDIQEPGPDADASVKNCSGIDFGKEVSEGEAKMKVAEIAKAMSKAKSKPKPCNVSGLVMLWKELVSEVHGVNFVIVNGTQKGQLKHILNLCPPDTALTVVEWAVRNWEEFVFQVSVLDNKKTKSGLPSIGYLLQNLQVAVNCALTPKAKSKVVEHEAPSLPSPEPVQLIAETKPKPVQPKPATYEEFLAILNGDAEE